MGRIDLDRNYNYWTSMDWKNINDGKIYLDPETRKNMVSFRNNMMRLVDAYVDQKDFEKAEEILDLAMDKMPVDGLLHYGMLLGYPDAFYRMNKIDKARKVSLELMEKFEQNLSYYSQFEGGQLEVIFDEIESNLYLFDYIVKTTMRYDSEEYSNKTRARYVANLELYSHLFDE
jgi:tetratricopeptide (TPR) repeat protein